jgi:integrase/recombinase XerC
MSVTALELGDASRILREALKDKSYRSTPLGLEVARYIRWKRNEWGAAKDTIRDYEPILARLALFFSDLELKDLEAPVGAERLRECMDFHWGELSGRTRAKVRSVWVDFFDWAVREGRGIHGNPARILASPKKRGVKREPFGKSMVDKVLASQDYLGDKLGVMLILLYGLRRAEIAGVRFRDFDFERRTLVLTGKGGKVRTIPIVEEAFWRDLGALELELGGHDAILDWFPVCPRRKVGMRTYYQHHHGFVPRSVHRWWYARLEAAGIVDEGVVAGFGMHRGRHTVASDILRRTGNLTAAQELLGHADIGTTRDSYASFDTSDLARVLHSMRDTEDDL